MDFEWVAIALGDVAWISLAFFLGFLANLIRLPPLVGFLATGFVLNYRPRKTLGFKTPHEVFFGANAALIPLAVLTR